MQKILLAGLFTILTSTLFSQTPTVTAAKTNTTITVNGNLNESAWQLTNSITKTIVGTPNNTVVYGVTWNNTYLYIGIKVTDGNLFNDSPSNWDDDAVEVYIDADNNGGTAYGTNDRQFVKEWNGTLWEKASKTTGVLHAWAAVTGGYTVEMAIPWSNIGISNPANGRIIGFDLGNDDDDNGTARESQLMWSGDNNNWQYPRNFGDLVLANASSDTQAPTAPTNLAASNLTGTSVNLSWTASTDNVGVTGYDVYRNGTKINTALVTATSYNATGLTPATSYTFNVVARDAGGNTSTNSNTINVTTPDTQAPTAPTNLTSASVTATSLTLNWTASTDNVAVTGYDVYRNNVKINTAPVITTTYSVTGLTQGTAYNFYVKAFDAIGNMSANSNTLAVTTTDTQAPTAPTNLSSSAVTSTTLTLSWTAATDNLAVTGYDIFRNGAKINTSVVTTTTYNVTGLVASTAYSFYVQARDAAGNLSTNSNTVNVTTPAAPQGCTGTGSINFQRWNNVTGTAVSNLTSLSTYPNSPSTNTTITTFEIPSNAADNYGARVYGWICPPTTGNYTFWIASDDNGELWLSTTSSSANKVRIAYHTQYTGSREWNKYTTQKSAVIALNAGQLYYVEALMKEGTGGDNLAVGWAKPGQATTAPSEVIPGTSLIRTQPDTQAPTAPTNLNAASITQTTFTLNYTASSDNVGVTGYDIYQNGVKINTANIAATTYDVTGLTAGTSYNFYVVAKDAAGNISANSSTLPVTTQSPDTQAPTAPTALSSSSITQTAFVLSWTASTDNVAVTGYDVYRDGVKVNSSNITGTTFSVSGLTAGTTYNMYVVAKDAAGNSSGNSVAIDVTTLDPDSEAPTAATDLASSNITRTSFTLSWAASTDNTIVVGYDVYSDGLKVNTSDITTTSFELTGLTAGTTYSVYVVAKDGAGNLSANSTALDVTTQAPDIQAPTAPTNLGFANLTTTSFTLNWTASSDDTGVSGYDVYKNGTKINTSLIVGLSYSVTGLTPSTGYAFTVKAKDAAVNESVASAVLNVTTLDVASGTETFSMRTVIANQRMPHDLVYGPDNNIWFTERFAGRVSKLNPVTGVKTVVLTLGSKMVKVSGQDGLMGLALHPQFNSGKPFVYISYTYQSTSSTVRKTRIEKYTYDAGTQTLISPETVLENIPGSNDHNSARIAIGPDLKLYYTVGDMGAGQFDNASRTNNAQNLNVYEGKVLRLNAESIAGSWIPTDNPFTNGGQPTAVYSFGHRNPQGLVWGNVNGVDILYSSEHGPFSDDEVNIIERSRNYGWPQVAGFCDGNYNGRTIGGFAVVSEQNNCATLNAKEPLKSLFPAANPPQEGTDNMTWPSTAPSGTEFYGSTGIPGWKNSLLLAELKKGVVARLKLSNDGMSVISDTINYFRGLGRFRDVVVSPDGLKLYVACDSSGSTSGPTGGVTATPANPGSILEFTYTGPIGGTTSRQASRAGRVNEDTKDKSIDVYPNPASTFIIVYNYKDAVGRSIELFDLNGRLVKKVHVTNLATRIETSGMANGFYILKVTDAKGKSIRTEKIVIQK